MTATQLGLDFLRVLLPERARILFAGEQLTATDEVVARISADRGVPHGWQILSQHLLLPRADRPRLVLPAAPAGLLFRALHSYRPSRRLAQMALVGVRAAARVGAFGQLPWRRVTVLRRVGSRPEQAALWEDLQGKAPHASVWAASTGTAGPFRKASLRVMDGNGYALAHAKVGRCGPAGERVGAEAEALTRLAELPLRRARVPRLLTSGGRGDHRWLVQEHLGDGAGGAPSWAQIGDFHVELLGMTGRWAPLSSGDYWTQLASRLKELPNSAAADAWQVRCRPLAQRSMRVGVMHGDLAPWNAMRCSNGQLAIFDWETMCEGAPPLLDVMHWLLYEPLLVGRRSGKALLEGVLRGAEGEHLRSIAARLSCEVPLLALLSLYLVDAVSRLEVEQRAVWDSARALQIGRLERLLRAVMVVDEVRC